MVKRLLAWPLIALFSIISFTVIAEAATMSFAPKGHKKSTPGKSSLLRSNGSLWRSRRLNPLKSNARKEADGGWTGRTGPMTLIRTFQPVRVLYFHAEARDSKHLQANL